MVTRQRILELIPHQGAMCLLESALSWSATEITCVTRSHLSPDNPLRRGGRLHPVCGIEYGLQDIIQAIAACPSVVSTILADVDRIVAGEMRIGELVDGISDDVDESEMKLESEEDDVEAQPAHDDPHRKSLQHLRPPRLGRRLLGPCMRGDHVDHNVIQSRAEANQGRRKHPQTFSRPVTD